MVDISLPAGHSRSNHVNAAVFMLWVALVVVCHVTSKPRPSVGSEQRKSEIRQSGYGKHAIVTLLNNDERAVSKYCLALKSLSKHSILKPESPILVFHEDDFPAEAKGFVASCTTNPLSFHLADFSFPANFNGDLENEMNSAIARQGTRKEPKRKMWGYAHMIRFWTTQLWTHPAIVSQNYVTVMRIDADSCFVDTSDDAPDDNQFLPGMRGRYIYRTDSHGVGVDTYIKDLYGFAVRYMKNNGITPRNPELWKFVTETWESQRTLPIFYKNFEIVRVSFMMRKDVMAWHQALTEEEPFGVYRYRWSDANTRLLTMAMFGKPETLLEKKHTGYRHGKECIEYHKQQNNQV